MHAIHRTLRHLITGVLPLAGGLILLLLVACNESLDPPEASEPDVVRSLDLTVTGSSVQAPYGNVYLFHTLDADLDYATGYGAGLTTTPELVEGVPLIDVSTPYSPVVRYVKAGEVHTLHPVSPYGEQAAGALDNHSSPRYSQVHFDIERLSADYGRVQKGSIVLVVIVLNDPQSHSWVAHTVQLRRDYLIHVSLPDYKTPTFVTGAALNAKWWQEEGINN